MSVTVAAGCLVFSWSLWFGWYGCVFRLLPVTGGSWWKVEVLVARSKNEVKSFLVQKHYFEIMTTAGSLELSSVAGSILLQSQFLSSPWSSLGVEIGWKLNLCFRRYGSGWKMKTFGRGKNTKKTKQLNKKIPTKRNSQTLKQHCRMWNIFPLVGGRGCGQSRTLLVLGIPRCKY